jgi:hypothetical protein
VPFVLKVNMAVEAANDLAKAGPAIDRAAKRYRRSGRRRRFNAGFCGAA